MYSSKIISKSSNYSHDLRTPSLGCEDEGLHSSPMEQHVQSNKWLSKPGKLPAECFQAASRAARHKKENSIGHHSVGFTPATNK